MKKKGLIDDTFIKMVMSWGHVSGFNIHNGVRIKSDNEKSIEKLLKNIISKTFSLEELNHKKNANSVLYHSKMTHDKNNRNFEISTPQVIKAATKHISE